MNKIVSILILGILLIFSIESFAQSDQSSWSVGFFGLTYPRFQKSVVKPENSNFGYNVFLQRNFTGNIALRLKGSYLSMKGRIPGNMFSYTDDNPVKNNTEIMRSNIAVLDLNFLYKFFPLAFASPYLGAGVGGTLISPSYPADITDAPSKTKTAAELNLFIGSEWSLKASWKLVTEIGYHASGGYLDGLKNSGNTGTFPESYLTASANVEYYFGIPDNFDAGKSYSGLRGLTFPTINPNIKGFSIKPLEISNDKTAEVYPYTKNGLSTIIIYFKLNQSKVQPEFHPILNVVAAVLKSKPGVNLEIRGYTDSIGSKKYNNLLSTRRAESVLQYLVKQGINTNRLSTKGFGEENAAASNKTAEGNTKNRRVNFLVK